MGYWVLTRYDDCRSVLVDKSFGQGDFVRNIQIFYGEEFDVLSHPAYAWLSRVFVMQDPPDHTRLRNLIAGALSLKRIREMEPRVRLLAQRLLDKFADMNGGNFVTEFAYRFPTLVMCDMLGLEDSEFSDELLLKLNQAIADTFVVFETRALSELDLAKADSQTLFLINFFDELFDRRRKEPRDDLTTAMVFSEDEGTSLTPEELSTSVIGLFGAGFETTAHMIANGLYLLAVHPEQRDALQLDSSLSASANEEILRFESSLQATYRTALSPQQISGHDIAEGERILTIVAAANRDGKHFSNPEAFDIRSRDEKSLTFGGGIHYCIGAELARMEGRVFLEELFGKYAKFSVDVDNAVRRNAFLFRGFEQLPVSLRA